MSDINLKAELGPQYNLLLMPEEGISIDGSASNTAPIKLQVGVGNSNGAGSGSTYHTTVGVTAAEDLNAYMAVTHHGVKAVNTQESLGAYAGVTPYAVVSGTNVNAIRAGLVTDSGWSWTPNLPIFIGTDSLMTQTPSSGIIRRIGWAISPIQVNMDPFPIINGD